jgi:hypothetical protein
MAQVCTTYTDIDGNEQEYCYDDGSNSVVDPITYDPTADDVDYSKIYDWNTNADGSNQKLNADGSVSYRDPDGSEYTVQRNGVYTTQSEGKTWNYDPKQGTFVGDDGKPLAGNVPSNLLAKTLAAVKANPLAALGTAYGALKSFGSSNANQGYSKPVPQMDAVRQQIQYNDPNRVAGSSGRQYFTDPKYVKEGDAASLAAAQAADAAQARGILAAYKPTAAPAANPWAGKMPTKWNTPAPATTATQSTEALAAVPTKEQLMDPNFKIGMASGGIAQARYLQGGTDGMADKIPANIDGDQPAALSHGEFVIPADVVSHLGNGNSEAGADKLYQMMARIRKARTGNEKQGKKINPDKFMPGGLAAAYASGGSVKGFDGTTGSAVTSSAATSAGGVPLDQTKTSNLAPWAGDYITNLLGQGAALAKQPYQAYTGPLTAGESDLQKQAFAGISDVAATGYDPTKFTTGTFNTQSANQYMNPYLMSALQPQIDEARRQSLITQQQNAGKMTQAGAFGGSRQALMDTETQRALGANLANITGSGYNKAYDAAMAQFNAEQNRGLEAQQATEKSRQYSADYGLKSLSDLLSAGSTQRGIEGEGIAADKKQFEEQQAYPFNMVEFQRKLVEGLPTGSTTTGVNQDALSKMQSDVSGLLSAYQTLAKLGLK